MSQPIARYLDGPVAIIGAGIGGLTAALALQHFGVPVRVFEQARTLREIGAGVTITPNAMNVLDFLGIGPALAWQAGETPRYFVRSAADGDLVFLHVHSTGNPQDRGNAIVDIFRVDHGKIAEHWDVIEPVPEHAANDNTMF